jgi:hypothetical protein
VKTTRRATLAAALGLSLLFRRSSAAIQELGKIEAKSTFAWFPPLPDDREDWPISILTFAEIAGYWAVKGIEQPRSFDDETSQLWLEVSQRIPLNDGILFQYIVEEWDEMIGFNPWDVDQVAVAFDPPNQIRVYTGVFDPERIARRLQSADYEVRTEGDFTVLDNPADAFDLTSNLGRVTLGNFKHLATTDSMVMASRSRDQLDRVLAIAAGDAESLADTPELADLAPIIPDFHGCIIVNDAIPGATAGNADQDEDKGKPPPLGLHTAGYAAEDSGESISLIADLGNASAAQEAVAVITGRIANDLTEPSRVPYAELFGDYEVDVVPGTDLLRVTVANEDFALGWMQFVYTGDFRVLFRS